jgi:hypothetical protein
MRFLLQPQARGRIDIGEWTPSSTLPTMAPEGDIGGGVRGSAPGSTCLLVWRPGTAAVLRVTIEGVASRTASRYNQNMRRRLASVVYRVLPCAAALCLAVALAVTGGVAAADPARDPRCAEWEQHGAPPGIDMRLVCAATEVIDTYTGQTAGDVTREPAAAWAAAALVTGLGLAIVAVLATRFIGGRAGRRLAPESPDAWWVCPSCQSLNAVGRPACYACHQTPDETGPPGGAIVMRRGD